MNARARTGHGGWHALPLQRLPERPFRTLPGGSLRKFLRRLSQFPLSFLAQSRWVPRSSGELRSRALPPLRRNSAANKKNGKGPGRLQAWPLNASPCSIFYYLTARRENDRCLVGAECSDQLPGKLNSQGLPKTVTAPTPVPRAAKCFPALFHFRGLTVLVSNIDQTGPLVSLISVSSL